MEITDCYLAAQESQILEVFGSFNDYHNWLADMEEEEDILLKEYFEDMEADRIISEQKEQWTSY